MKQSIILMLLLIACVCNGQNYGALVGQAFQLEKAKDYPAAIKKYKAAFKFKSVYSRHLYTAGRTAALAGDKELAFKWLNKALSKGMHDLRYMKRDTGLVSLYDDKRWTKLVNKMQALSDKVEANYNKPAMEALMELSYENEALSRKYFPEEDNNRLSFGHKDSLIESWENQKHILVSKLTDIIDTYGWLSPKKVGNQASTIQFIILGYADIETQKKYLPLMREAFKRSEARPGLMATIEDKVALKETGMQIYGSLIGYDTTTQKNYIYPLKDPYNVDLRRAKIGLEPIAKYASMWGIKWERDDYKER